MMSQISQLIELVLANSYNVTKLLPLFDHNYRLENITMELAYTHDNLLILYGQINI